MEDARVRILCHCGPKFKLYFPPLDTNPTDRTQWPSSVSVACWIYSVRRHKSVVYGKRRLIPFLVPVQLSKALIVLPIKRFHAYWHSLLATHNTIIAHSSSWTSHIQRELIITNWVNISLALKHHWFSSLWVIPCEIILLTLLNTYTEQAVHRMHFVATCFIFIDKRHTYIRKNRTHRNQLQHSLVVFFATLTCSVL